MKNKTLNITALALFQIFLIISITPMFAEKVSAFNFTEIKKFYEDKYVVNESYSIENQFSASETLSGVNFGCCPITKNGAVCQNIPMENEDECAEEIHYETKCDFYEPCKKGCCVDEEEGLCSPKVHKILCEEAGGKFEEDIPTCEGGFCQKGCCVLGGNTEYITEKRCEVKSEEKGYEKDFRQGKNQIECLELQENQSEGACVFENNECRFLTKSECLKRTGSLENFEEDYLCSHHGFDNDCERQDSIGCAHEDGKNEIYWFDSCGNRENIYSSNKEESWNNGKVLEKSESCNPDSANIESETCGNCNYALSSICSETDPEEGVEDGDYICEDLGCVDPYTGERYNHGESWCIYDSYIGEGKDTPGSRHWLASCINGEIEVEGCADYRRGICIQSEIAPEQAEEEDMNIISNNDEGNFSIAHCVLNQAFTCLGLNNTKCAEKEMCTLKRVDVTNKFSFDICTGKYPRGFPLEGATNTNTQNRQREPENICSLMSMNCTVVYQKDWKGSWDCEKNCDCEKQEFAEKMNDACMALGDCGTHVNYIGEGTNNIEVENTPDISWERYEQYAEIVPGKYAKPESLEKILEEMDIDTSGLNHKEKMQKATNILGSISGGVTALKLAITTETGKAALGKIGGAFLGKSGASSLAGGIQAAGTVAFGAALGAWAGSEIASHYELYGRGGLAMVVGGAMVGAGLAMYTMMTGYLASLGPYGIIIGAVLMVWTVAVGWGEVKEIVVDFECNKWNPPVGGEDCSQCNEDPLKPCSEYRCQSLGLACELLNKNTENATCKAVPDDGQPPVITSGETSDGYKFIDEQEDSVKIRTENNNCIKEFDTVVYSLKTSEPAECRYSYERETEFEDMEENFLEGNKYFENHTGIIEMPSVDSLDVYRREINEKIEKIDAEFIEEEIAKGNIPETINGHPVDPEQYAENTKQQLIDAKESFDEVIDKYGNMDMYVKCQDFHGHVNEKEYAVNFCVNTGPDRTAAGPIGFNPADNSYIKFGTETQEFEVMLSEPADCKWSYSEGMNYENMENSMECKTGLENYGEMGWICKSEIDNIQEGENTIYLKCKDQPWLPKDNESRNINNKDFEYTLKTSDSELKITSIKPDEEEIETDAEPFYVTLEVETEGGAEHGKADCYYRFKDQSQETEFYDSNSDIHRTVFDKLLEGEHNIFLRCEDAGGNTAKNTTKLKLDVDDEPPKIVRAYHSGGNLVVNTDEKAECYYSLNNCLFEIDDGEKMTTALSIKHMAEWKNGRKYYIKCRDGWGNRNNDCAGVIEAE